MVPAAWLSTNSQAHAPKSQKWKTSSTMNSGLCAHKKNGNNRGGSPHTSAHRPTAISRGARWWLGSSGRLSGSPRPQPAPTTLLLLLLLLILLLLLLLLRGLKGAGTGSASSSPSISRLILLRIAVQGPAAKTKPSSVINKQAKHWQYLGCHFLLGLALLHPMPSPCPFGIARSERCAFFLGFICLHYVGTSRPSASRFKRQEAKPFFEDA